MLHKVTSNPQHRNAERLLTPNLDTYLSRPLLILPNPGSKTQRVSICVPRTGGVRVSAWANVSVRPHPLH